MKVNNNKDSVDLSHVSRSKRGDKAGKANSKAADESAAPSPGTIGDVANVDISSEAKSVANANAIARANDTDEAKIARVKAMINGGTYKPDFGKVADKMMNEQLLQETS
jgi:flagellar biosynthesis anti-sigma factor FlgM